MRKAIPLVPLTVRSTRVRGLTIPRCECPPKRVVGDDPLQPGELFARIVVGTSLILVLMKATASSTSERTEEQRDVEYAITPDRSVSPLW